MGFAHLSRVGKGRSHGGGGIAALNAALSRSASRWRFVAGLQMLDFLIFFAAGYYWLHTLGHGISDSQRSVAVIAALLIAIMSLCVFQCLRLYDFDVVLRAREGASRSCCASVIASAPVVGMTLLATDVGGDTVLPGLAFVAPGIAGLAVLRVAIARLADALQRSGLVTCRVFIIGDSPAATDSMGAILESLPGKRVIGTWHLPTHVNAIDDALQGALNLVRLNQADIIILKLPFSRADRMAKAASVLRRLPCPVLLVPTLDSGDEIVLRGDGRYAAKLGAPGDLMLVELSEHPLAGWRWVAKDIEDRTIALLLLIFLAPVLLAIMIGIKFADRGTIFFLQKRRGYDGRTFDIIKFRTMRVQSCAGDGNILNLTTKGDPRIFPFGRLLRGTSLDELPQLLNVLRGDMWIVGPRPHSPVAQAAGMIYAEAIQDYTARYRIKPGITGWAQVRGWRGPTDTLEQLVNRVEHDLYYIDNWSLWFDIEILFRTVICVLGHENAF